MVANDAVEAEYGSSVAPEVRRNEQYVSYICYASVVVTVMAILYGILRGSASGGALFPQPDALPLWLVVLLIDFSAFCIICRDHRISDVLGSIGDVLVARVELSRLVTVVFMLYVAAVAFVLFTTGGARHSAFSSIALLSATFGIAFTRKRWVQAMALILPLAIYCLSLFYSQPPLEQADGAVVENACYIVTAIMAVVIAWDSAHRSNSVHHNAADAH